MLPLRIEADQAATLPSWIRDNDHYVRTALNTHGALLFRGFAVSEAADVTRVARSVMAHPVTENGEHVAVAGTDGVVQTPVLYAPESKLLWHNENTFNAQWPRRILFACGRTADSGGETPLVDSREVFRRIPRELREPFLKKGVMYIRNYYADGLGLSWSKVFGTSRREEVEAMCRRDGFDYEWHDDDSLKTVAVRPAAYQHPQTADWTWCNQAQHWHDACLDPVVRDYYRSEKMPPDRYPRSCRYGDGAPIPDEVMQAILDIYQELEVVFPWRQGDALLVDNLLVAHGRNPYRGERKLFVAIGDTLSVGRFEPVPE